MEYKVSVDVSLTVPCGRELDVDCEVKAHAHFVHHDMSRLPILVWIDLETVILDGRTLSEREIDYLPSDTIAEIMEQTECIAKQCLDSPVA